MNEGQILRGIMTNPKKGFTLIELLIVIAIIGILSAIGLVSLNGAREKARDAQRKSDLGQYRTALAVYADDHDNTYPPTVGPMDNSDTAPDGSIFGANNNPLVPRYLSSVMKPATAGFRYAYFYDTNHEHTPTAHTAFILYSKMESGERRYFFLKSDGTSGLGDNVDQPEPCAEQDVCSEFPE